MLPLRCKCIHLFNFLLLLKSLNFFKDWSKSQASPPPHDVTHFLAFKIIIKIKIGVHVFIHLENTHSIFNDYVTSLLFSTNPHPICGITGGPVVTGRAPDKDGEAMFRAGSCRAWHVTVHMYPQTNKQRIPRQPSRSNDDLLWTRNPPGCTGVHI